VRSLPAVVRAARAGELSIEHVDLFARANQPKRAALYAAHEQMLVEQCTALTFDDGARALRYWSDRADDAVGSTAGSADPSDPSDPSNPDAPADPTGSDGAGSDAGQHNAGPRDASGGELHISTTLDDMVVLDGVFGAISGSIIAGELARLEREVHLADQQAGIHRTPAQRRAAALLAMAQRSASTPADARRPRPLFTVLLGDESFARLCELANGVILRPEQLLAHVDAALLETVLFDGPSTVISVSSKRTFTGTLRRAIEVRDRRCQHPSACDIRADRCDVDHIVPYREHGPTSQFNGRLECPTHNRRSDMHDHGASPAPPRELSRLDELRARIRWRCEHQFPDDWSDADPWSNAHAGNPAGHPTSDSGIDREMNLAGNRAGACAGDHVGGGSRLSYPALDRAAYA
jgi:hypothetical protein